MSSTVRLFNNVAASTTVANIMAGNRFEFVPRMSHVAVYQVIHDAGAQTVAAVFDGDGQATISFGNVVIADDIFVPASPGIERNKHLVAAGVADGGDRIIISITNNDAAVAVDFVTQLEITDL